MKPNFLIIGASRCGTTSLFHYLRAHPDVYVAKGKELHFFDLHYGSGWGSYLEAFRAASGKSAVGEATPAYMYDPESVFRIATTLPDACLIAILRDPVERAYSHYWANRVRGRETLDFEAAIAAEPERLRIQDKQNRLNYSYLDQGRYLEQLRRVTDHFARDRLFVALFDDLMEDPHSLFVDVASFLAIDASRIPAVVGDRVNGYQEFRSLRLRELGKKAPSALRNAIGRVNARPSTYPPMRPATRARLVERFSHANDDLGSWLGRDLIAWNAVRRA